MSASLFECKTRTLFEGFDEGQAIGCEVGTIRQ
jgi:hypothetical protein